MKKSPQAFRTISEVSKVLDVPAHVLRFWESRFSQIKPVKRGGGRRYYRPEDVDLIRGIRNLLYIEGLTIKGAQKILRDKGMRHVVAIGRGEDAQIAEADALWDEPGVGELAKNAPKQSVTEAAPAKRPTPPKAPDPRQTSLFGDDDLADSVLDDASDLAEDEPEIVSAFRETAHAPVQPAEIHSAVPANPEVVQAATIVSQQKQPADSVASETDHDELDQDALRKVFGKLKALRASMDDD